VDESTPIKISTIRVIYSALVPTYNKLYALAVDALSENFPLSETDKSILLEQCSMALALKCLFEEYFKEADENSVETLHLKKEEFITVLSLAKSVETAERTLFKNTGIWEH